MAGRRLTGGLLLTVGNVVSALGSFVRNIIIARLVSVEDFGIAATFALTVAMIELCSNLAIDRLLVQAPDGDDEELQATAHTIQLAQGIVGAIVLFLIATPIANLFDIPEVAWAFQLLALVPLIRGLSHLDRCRFQREMRFGPAVLVETGPQVAATLAAIPATYFAGDYTAMLWVVFTQIILLTVFSHLVAKRRYSISWRWPLVRRALSFGIPLVLNGFLMFGIFQGDRAIVGATFGMTELGWFGAAFALTLAPTMVIARICQSFFLPQLAKAQYDEPDFSNTANVTMQVCLLGGILVAVGFSVAGPSLINVLYGERYMAGAAVIGILGIMQGIRVTRAGPTIVSIARGQTTAPLWANIVRTIGLGISLVAVWKGFGVMGIAVGSLAGEVIALASALWLIHLRARIDVSHFTGMFVAACGVAITCITAYTYVLATGNALVDIAAGCILAAFAVALALAFMRHTKTWLRRGPGENG